MDHMLDTIYSSTGTDPEVLETVSAAFDYVNKAALEIGARQTT